MLAASPGVASAARGGSAEDLLSGIESLRRDPRASPLDHELRLRALRVRVEAAVDNFEAPIAPHPDNGDEERYRNKIGTDTRGLPHDDRGEVDLGAYRVASRAHASREGDDFEAIPLGGTRKLVNPIGTLAVSLIGTTPPQIGVPPASALASAQKAAEAVEVYWKALLRDIPLESYADSSDVADAIDEIDSLSGYTGPRAGGRVTLETLFRGSVTYADPRDRSGRTARHVIPPGVLDGPYISQFLLRDIPYGPQRIEGAIRTALPGNDFQTEYDEWLAVQNGIAPTRTIAYDPVRRYISTGRARRGGRDQPAPGRAPDLPRAVRGIHVHPVRRHAHHGVNRPSSRQSVVPSGAARLTARPAPRPRQVAREPPGAVPCPWIPGPPAALRGAGLHGGLAGADGQERRAGRHVKIRSRRGLLMSDLKTRKRTPPNLRESQKEQLLRYIVSTFPYSIWWKDRDCVYIGTNELNARGAGLSRPDDIIGLTDHDLPWTAEEAEHYIRVDKAVMASGEPLLNIEETQRQADGSHRYLLTCKVPLKDEDGEVFGILGAWTDITERKLTELALERAKDEAERANRAKSDFLATVSHELRTPLTLILSPLERLLEAQHGALPRNVRDELELIRRNTARLLNVVSDLLHFSKAEAARMGVDWELVEINRFTSQMLDDIRPSAAGRGRTLAMTGDALGVVSLDRYKYERILLNLISNALKFSHPGGHIEVALRALDDASFELCVRDEGIGIAGDDLGKLFSKFTQVDGSVKRRYEGTGLGLSLVKQFAELMCGSVSIESELGQGTAVRVRLPRSAPGAAQEHAASAAGGHAERHAGPDLTCAPSTAQTRRWLSSLPPMEASPDGLAPAQPEPDAGDRGAGALPSRPPGPPSAAPPPARAGRPLLLLVDDNPDMRQFMRSLLSPSYRLMEAADGLEAQRLIERSPPHVVVSDVMMPLMSGVELTAWLKAHPVLRHIPIVLVTARADDEAVASGLDGGADEYLVKPFSPRELLARVRSMVRLYESYRQLGAEQAEIARHSGMAQVAMDVLHSAGNTLNSAGIAVDLARDRIARSRLPRLKRALAELVGGDAGAVDPAGASRGESLRRYVELALVAVEQEQQETADDLERMRAQLDALRDALRAQERYAYRNAYRTERLSVNEVIHESLRAHGPALVNARVAVRLELRPVDDVVANRHDLLTILYNLLDNARAAVDGGPREPWIAISTWQDAAGVCCAVEDNGPGVPEAARVQVFQYGFTTREGASGIGLHFSANRMKTFGGSIRIEDGRERGARVVLTFAAAPAAAPLDGEAPAR